jgi:pimeloyl-ACP methyl ester carboxylesterase
LKDSNVEPPETRYTKSGDAHIAYQVVGDGPIDLLFVNEWLNHIDEQWGEPRIATFLDGLTQSSRLILFNPRGVGASDPLPTTQSPTAEEWMDDGLAALDAVGIEQAAVLGVGAGRVDRAPARRVASRTRLLASRLQRDGADGVGR